MLELLFSHFWRKDLICVISPGETRLFFHLVRVALERGDNDLIFSEHDKRTMAYVGCYENVEEFRKDRMKLSEYNLLKFSDNDSEITYYQLYY